jgi:hypothetical protein
MKKTESYVLGLAIVGLVFWTLICVLPASAAENNPCSEDIAKFCKNAAPNRTAIMECLETNEKKLTAACKDYEAKVMEGIRGEKREQVKAQKKFLQSCRTDITKLCKNAEYQVGGYVKCVNDHKKELSSTCAAWVAAQQEEKTK